MDNLLLWVGVIFLLFVVELFSIATAKLYFDILFRVQSDWTKLVVYLAYLVVGVFIPFAGIIFGLEAFRTRGLRMPVLIYAPLFVCWGIPLFIYSSKRKKADKISQRPK